MAPGVSGGTAGPQAVPMRGESSAAVALVLVAGVMLAISAVGMLLLARRVGGLGPIGTAAWAVAGVVLLARAESIARSQRVTVVAA